MKLAPQTLTVKMITYRVDNLDAEGEKIGTARSKAAHECRAKGYHVIKAFEEEFENQLLGGFVGVEESQLAEVITKFRGEARARFRDLYGNDIADTEFTKGV